MILMRLEEREQGWERSKRLGIAIVLSFEEVVFEAKLEASAHRSGKEALGGGRKAVLGG